MSNEGVVIARGEGKHGGGFIRTDNVRFFETQKADSHIACRTAKGLECVFHI